MRKALDNLLSQTVGLRFTLPFGNVLIPKVTVTTHSDECYNVITNNNDLAKVIYNGIIEYSFDESEIDMTKLDLFQKRAFKTKLKFDANADSRAQLNYGFYGETLLYLMLQKFHNVGTMISRGHFYYPLENNETKGYDTYQIMLKDDGKVELWFGEVKFQGNYSNGVPQILDKIKLSLSDSYFGKNIIAMEDYETYMNTDINVSSLLAAFRDDPDVNFAVLAREHNMSFVYPMLVIFNDRDKTYDEIIKQVANYINEKYTKLDIDFSMEYSLFFMFLPVHVADEIKDIVRSWILSGEPLI